MQRLEGRILGVCRMPDKVDKRTGESRAGTVLLEVLVGEPMKNGAVRHSIEGIYIQGSEAREYEVLQDRWCSVPVRIWSRSDTDRVFYAIDSSRRIQPLDDTAA